jgi:hypothetical protein
MQIQMKSISHSYAEAATLGMMVFAERVSLIARLGTCVNRAPNRQRRDCKLREWRSFAQSPLLDDRVPKKCA